MLPHPTYEQFGQRVDQQQARRKHGITASKVLLFFGFVRRYKGLDRLVAAMPEIVRRLPEVHLLIVGEFFEPKEEYLAPLEQAGLADHVTVVDRYVPNEEVGEWFSAADMLVLPYHSATNSGIVQIGYNFATPAIVTDVGSLSEVVIDERTGFVLPDAAPETIAAAVERMYQGDRLERFSANIVEERKKYSWDAFASGMIEFVRQNSPS
jgi:glycosyltransferase involved in cell wall biosynthesis